MHPGELNLNPPIGTFKQAPLICDPDQEAIGAHDVWVPSIWWQRGEWYVVVDIQTHMFCEMGRKVRDMTRLVPSP